MGQDLAANRELLFHNRRDPGGIGGLDHGTHLGAINTGSLALLEQRIEGRVWLHQLDAVGLVLKSLVHFQKRHDPA